MALYDDVLQIINNELVPNSEITADRHREVETALLNYISSSFVTGDIKEVDCTEAYIAANFDGTGLGINEREGWAICNGQNGTKNRNGKVAIARGTSYPSVGTSMSNPVVGGSENAVVVAHTHTYTQYTLDQEVSKNGDGVRSLNKNNTQTGVFTTSTAGESGTGKNMQPYIVSLFIMKR